MNSVHLVLQSVSLQGPGSPPPGPRNASSRCLSGSPLWRWGRRGVGWWLRPSWTIQCVFKLFSPFCVGVVDRTLDQSSKCFGAQCVEPCRTVELRSHAFGRSQALPSGALCLLSCTRGDHVDAVGKGLCCAEPLHTWGSSPRVLYPRQPPAPLPSCIATKDNALRHCARL